MFYYKNINDIATSLDGLIAKIELSDNFQMFIEQCYNQLRFPDYFGFNMDSISDCLRDLSWLKEQTVNIVIINSIQLLSKSTLKDYIELFCDIEKFWQQYCEKFHLESDIIYAQHKKQLPWLSEDEIKNLAMPRSVRFYFSEEDKIKIDNLISHVDN